MARKLTKTLSTVLCAGIVLSSIPAGAVSKVMDSLKWIKATDASFGNIYHTGASDYIFFENSTTYYPESLTICDTDMNVVSTIQKGDYSYIDYSTIENHLLVNNGNKTGLIDATGKVILPCVYDNFYESSDGNYFAVCRDKKWGIIDRNRQEIVPYIYSSIYPMQDTNLFKVTLDNKEGVVNASGKLVVPCSYDYISSVSPDGTLFAVKFSGKYGVINDKGQMIMPFVYSIINFTDKHIKAYDENWDEKYYTYSGKAVINGNVGNEWASCDEGIWVIKNQYQDNQTEALYGFDGKPIIPFKYKEILDITNVETAATHYVVKTTNDKYGVVNAKGKETITPQYDSIKDKEYVYQGKKCLYARKGKTYGFIDYNNNVVVPFTSAKYAYYSADGKIVFVTKDASTGLMGLIDASGKVLAPNKYTFIESDYKHNDYFEVFKDGKYGIMDINGKEIIPTSLNFDVINHLTAELFAVSKGFSKGVVTRGGAFVVPMDNYDNVYAYRGYIVLTKRSANGDSETAVINLDDLTTTPFNDISNNPEEKAVVSYAYSNGIMSGTSNTTFAPTTPLTRAMFVTILHRAAGTPFAPKSTFTDVADGTWYTDAVSWANAIGVVTGVSEELFAPNNNITREQLAVILYRYALRSGKIAGAAADMISSLSDGKNVSPYATEAVNWALENNIVDCEADGKFNAKENATRITSARAIMIFNGYTSK